MSIWTIRLELTPDGNPPVKVEVNPHVVTAAFGTAQNVAVEFAGLSDTAHLNRDVKWSQHDVLRTHAIGRAANERGHGLFHWSAAVGAEFSR
jgi:hypothetical protein